MERTDKTVTSASQLIAHLNESTKLQLEFKKQMKSMKQVKDETQELIDTFTKAMNAASKFGQKAYKAEIKHLSVFLKSLEKDTMTESAFGDTFNTKLIAAYKKETGLKNVKMYDIQQIGGKVVIIGADKATPKVFTVLVRKNNKASVHKNLKKAAVDKLLKKENGKLGWEDNLVSTKDAVDSPLHRQTNESIPFGLVGDVVKATKKRVKPVNLYSKAKVVRVKVAGTGLQAIVFDERKKEWGYVLDKRQGGATHVFRNLKDMRKSALTFNKNKRAIDDAIKMIQQGQSSGMREEVVNQASIPTGPESIGKPDFIFKGSHGFDCDANTFGKCLQGKKANKHWNTYLSRDAELVGRVKAHIGTAKKGSNFVLRNKSTGEMVMARRSR